MEVVPLFMQLAAIQSPSGGEREVADYVRGQLAQIGVHAEEDGFAGADGTGNLYCRLGDPQPGRGLLFCAHLDTVPPTCGVVPTVEGGVLRNSAGSILGADNKAAVAVLLVALRRLLDQRVSHHGVELLFTVQEELGLQGSKAFDFSRVEANAGFVLDDASPVGSVIVGAPFQENVIVTFLGRAAHAGLEPELGRSAILAAARAISTMRHGRIDERSTVNVGVIGGGTARNVVPDRCTLEVDIRSFDGPTARALVHECLADCDAAAAAAGCAVEHEAFEGYPGYQLDDDSLPVRLSSTALRDCGHAPTLVVSGGGVDANVLNARGIPTVNLGNGMQRIHTPEEHIAARDLEAMVDVTMAIIGAASAEASGLSRK